MTEKKPSVTCKWLKDETILVNPDGQVVPCCYLANPLYRNLLDSNQGRMWDKTEVLKKYKNKKELYNLNHTPMNKILNSDWFNIDLPESWESYGTIPGQCLMFCDENYVEDI